MLVRVDLKSDHDHTALSMGVLARKLGRNESFYIRPLANSAAGCLPVRNKHDQRRPINRERVAREKGTTFERRCGGRNSKLRFWSNEIDKKKKRSMVRVGTILMWREQILVVFVIAFYKSLIIDLCNRLVDSFLKYRSRDKEGHKKTMKN